MNLPNSLTLLRILLTPVVVVLYAASKSGSPEPWFIALWLVYLVAEFTDVLDGLLARRMNLVSELGKVLDPLADVISRLTFFSLFLVEGLFPLWAFLPILYRELGITFLRMMMMKKGIALAANWAGKTKAGFYFATSLVYLLYITLRDLAVPLPDGANLVLPILAGVTAGISVLSLVPYLQAARKISA